MEPPHIWAGVWEGLQTGPSVALTMSFPNQKLQIPPNAGKLKVGNLNAIRFLDHGSDFVLPPGREAHGLVTPHMKTCNW